MKYGFVAPVLVLLIGLNVFPLCYNVVLSFSNAEISGGDWQFIGTRNYARVFSDPQYAAAIRLTAFFVVCAVTVELLLGFGLALGLRGRFPARPVILTILLVPMMLSPAVMGMYWHLILNGRYGVLNQILAAIGLPEPAWITAPNLKLLTMLIIDIWMWTPFMMLIALAGLSAIPDYVYEAAEIDRARPWTVFRRITLPMCGPLLVLAVLLRTTDALKQFDLVMAITGANDSATQTLSALLYQVAFRDFKAGLGASYACVVLVAVIALATVFVRYINHIQQRQGKQL
jgi:multiple sugar transport system permease protein